MELLKWKQPLGRPECPYCYRWVLNLGLFSVRLHKWVASDDERAHHNHPYWFITLILRGGYFDVTKNGREKLTAGCVRFRRAKHAHTVEIEDGKPCWSFLITGPKIHKWGFILPNGKWLRAGRYFDKFNYHQCK